MGNISIGKHHEKQGDKGTAMKKEITKRDKCPWECIGENTQSFVWWCSDCGAILQEEGTDLQNPMRIDHETYLCPDQNIKV